MDDNRIKASLTFVMDRERLMQHNNTGCAACGRKFSLGEVAVLACGAWEGGQKLMHEKEAVFIPRRGSYMDRKCVGSEEINEGDPLSGTVGQGSRSGA